MTLVPVQVLGRGDNTFTPLHSLHSDLHLLLYNVKFGKFEPVGFVSFLHLVCIVHAEKHKIECVLRLRVNLFARQRSSNIVEAVSEEKVWWSVRASDIYFGSLS
ncbi:hypothetical protein AAEP93_010737 [Penicillium crustosum]